jgi:hypothetical protein
MTPKSSVAALCASLALAATGLAQADNLVANGSFEASNTVATSWMSGASPLIQGFALVYSSTNNFNGPSNAAYGLYGPGTGTANGLTSSPDGGNFMGQDGDYNLYPFNQTINNLTVGSTYYLSFWWGAAQMRDQANSTTEAWNVKFGNDSKTTSTVTIPQAGFSGWMFQSYAFTATSASQVLTFTAVGTGAPPMSLLDGVTLSSTAPVPEPAGMALMGVGILGLVAVRRLRSRRGQG